MLGAYSLFSRGVPMIPAPFAWLQSLRPFAAFVLRAAQTMVGATHRVRRQRKFPI